MLKNCVRIFSAYIFYSRIELNKIIDGYYNNCALLWQDLINFHAI